MKRLHLLVILVFALLPVSSGYSAYYDMQKVADGIYAAIATPQGKIASNAVIIVDGSGVILAGSHFTLDGMAELTAEAKKITAQPIRQVILTHHHRGKNFLNLDYPPGAEIVMSWQTWQALATEYRELKNPVTFFDNSVTLRRGKRTIILNNTGAGHSDGDVIVYVPQENLLFASDLVFNDVVGYMGEGHMVDWVGSLEMMEGMDPMIVIPGVGKVTDGSGVGRFRKFFREFMTEVMNHLEAGHTFHETRKSFSLPLYETLPGYRQYLEINLKRAYDDLQRIVTRKQRWQ